MKNQALLFIFFSCSFFSIAQIQPVVRSVDRISEMTTLKLQMNGIVTLTDFSSRVASDRLLNKLGIEGTPYAKEDSAMGFFYLNNQLIKTPARLNYYLENFEFMYGGKVYVVTANAIDSVIIDSATYVYRTFKFNEKKIKRVVRIVDRQGNYMIYMYRNVEFKQEVKPGPLVNYKSAHFEWSAPIYLFEIDNKLIKLDSFKELMAAFPQKEKDIKRFIKEENIHKDNPDELKKLLGYIIKPL
jgi:hypothetical protein